MTLIWGLKPKKNPFDSTFQKEKLLFTLYISKLHFRRVAKLESAAVSIVASRSHFMAKKILKCAKYSH